MYHYTHQRDFDHVYNQILVSVLFLTSFGNYSSFSSRILIYRYTNQHYNNAELVPYMRHIRKTTKIIKKTKITNSKN